MQAVGIHTIQLYDLLDHGLIRHLFILLSVDASLFNDERFGVGSIASDFKLLVCSTSGSESSLSQCQVQHSVACTPATCPTEWGIKCFSKREREGEKLRFYFMSFFFFSLQTLVCVMKVLSDW